MENKNENQKFEELSEEQLKEVAGGRGFCSYIDGCKRQSDREPCVCYEWEAGKEHGDGSKRTKFDQLIAVKTLG